MCFSRRSWRDEEIAARRGDSIRDLFDREPEEPRRPTPVAEPERPEPEVEREPERVLSGTRS